MQLKAGKEPLQTKWIQQWHYLKLNQMSLLFFKLKL